MSPPFSEVVISTTAVAGIGAYNVIIVVNDHVVVNLSVVTVSIVGSTSYEIIEGVKLQYTIDKLVSFFE